MPLTTIDIARPRKGWVEWQSERGWARSARRAGWRPDTWNAWSRPTGLGPETSMHDGRVFSYKLLAAGLGLDGPTTGPLTIEPWSPDLGPDLDPSRRDVRTHGSRPRAGRPRNHETQCRIVLYDFMDERGDVATRGFESSRGGCRGRPEGRKPEAPAPAEGRLARTSFRIQGEAAFDPASRPIRGRGWSEGAIDRGLGEVGTRSVPGRAQKQAGRFAPFFRLRTRPRSTRVPVRISAGGRSQGTRVWRGSDFGAKT